MDCYQMAINIVKFNPSDKIKQIFSKQLCQATVQKHHMDANKILKIKAWWELHKNATRYTEQILETTPHAMW